MPGSEAEPGSLHMIKVSEERISRAAKRMWEMLFEIKILFFLDLT